ncbi:cytochrome c oxidase subunit I [Coralloluteibacterium stylophorae]|uniref:Cytochrome c oxidase subunit 1 n=1 Tax=Coralloluteibacterium stylophorae TaxID=1776034 RepID=A0A8J8AWQ6_9GAMM|nr:cytochrome c oxidase subunit I [Coralloluteibacterium stylophorae]MBS7456391.1 cytochrome c oxidase subunit I [Coralloluteibacterium stylophorae]
MTATLHREEPSYLTAEPGLWSWFTTRDHKRIAILYAIAITGFFLVGGIAAALMRAELATPEGDVLSAEAYNKTFSLHGIVMVWFFLIPSIPNTLGNFLLPLMIGARDLAFPRLNLWSWYVYIVGGVFTVAMLLAGGVDTGWTFYTPLSSIFSNTHVVLAVVGVFVVGFSSIFTAINFIVTVHTMRAPGMHWFRMPLFVWAMYATSLVMVLATPVLTATLALIGLERLFGVGIFDPALGGDPLLFQHLFWFYSHPAVYIMVLPAMGVTSELITCFARKRIFGYRFMAWSIMGIAGLGFLVWGHHMFVSGQSMYASMVFSILSYFVAVPSAIKVFNWTATLHNGHISFEAPMLYAIGFVGLFMLGGLTGLFLAATALDVHLTDTYFVIAHFHYIMVGGSVMAFLGGIHFWWPKITGRLYPEAWARFAAILMFFGFNLTFFPQYLLGIGGMPRRYHDYPEQYLLLNVLSSAGASILAVAYLLPLCYLTWSVFNGRRAPPNPWQASGLEWITTSPPPKHNFRRTPVVDFEAYDYEQESTR